MTGPVQDPKGWAAEMDRRLAEMERDPEGYIERVWADARRQTQADLPFLVRRQMRRKAARRRAFWRGVWIVLTGRR